MVAKQILYPTADVSQGNWRNNDSGSTLYNRINHGTALDSFVDPEYIRLNADSAPRTFTVDMGQLNVPYPTGMYFNIRASNAPVQYRVVLEFKDDNDLVIQETAGLDFNVTSMNPTTYTLTDNVLESNRTSWDLSNTKLQVSVEDAGFGLETLPWIQEVDIVVLGSGVGGLLGSETKTAPLFTSSCRSKLLLPYWGPSGDRHWGVNAQHWDDALSYNTNPMYDVDGDNAANMGESSVAYHLKGGLMHYDENTFIKLDKNPPTSGAGSWDTFAIATSGLFEDIFPNCGGYMSFLVSGVTGARVRFRNTGLRFKANTGVTGDFFLRQSDTYTLEFDRHEVKEYHIPLDYQTANYEEAFNLGNDLGSKWAYMYSEHSVGYTQASGDVKVYAVECSVYGVDFPYALTTPLYLCGAYHVDNWSLKPIVDVATTGQRDNYKWLGQETDMSGIWNIGYYPLERQDLTHPSSIGNIGPSGGFINADVMVPYQYDGWDPAKYSDITRAPRPSSIFPRGISFQKGATPTSEVSYGYDFDLSGVFSQDTDFSIFTSIALSGVGAGEGLVDASNWNNNMIYSQNRDDGEWCFRLEFNGDGEPRFSVKGADLIEVTEVDATSIDLANNPYMDICARYNATTQKASLYIRRPERLNWQYFEADTPISGVTRLLSSGMFNLGNTGPWSPFKGYVWDLGVADKLVGTADLFKIRDSRRQQPCFVEERQGWPPPYGWIGPSGGFASGVDYTYIQHDVPNFDGGRADSFSMKLEDPNEFFLHLDYNNPSAIRAVGWTHHNPQDQSGVTMRMYMDGPGLAWSGYPVWLPSGYNRFEMLGELVNNENFNNLNRGSFVPSELRVDLEYPNHPNPWSSDFRLYNTNILLDAWLKPAPTGSSDFQNPISDVITLYTAGTTAVLDSGNIDLFVSGHVTVSGSVDLFIEGGETKDDIPLFVQGLGNPTDTITLYIGDGVYDSGDFTMFVQGKASTSGNMPLYIGGYSDLWNDSGNFPLYIKGSTPGTTGLFDVGTLYVGGADLAKSGNINLFVQGVGETAATAYTNTMNLVLKSHGDEDGWQTLSSTSTLFIQNAYESENSGVPMVIWNQQGSNTSGAIPMSGTMNLFISRGTESDAHRFPMYIAGPSGYNDGMNLFMQGLPNTRSGVSMYIDGIGKTVSPIELYTHGF